MTSESRDPIQDIAQYAREMGEVRLAASFVMHVAKQLRTLKHPMAEQLALVAARELECTVENLLVAMKQRQKEH